MSSPRFPTWYDDNQQPTQEPGFQPIKLLEVIQEWGPEDSDPDPMQAYLQVAASIDGLRITLGVVVGVPDADKQTCKLAGCGVGPFLSIWWSDSSDWQDVPVDRREEAEEALAAEAPRLWRTAINSRKW